MQTDAWLEDVTCHFKNRDARNHGTYQAQCESCPVSSDPEYVFWVQLDSGVDWLVLYPWWQLLFHPINEKKKKKVYYVPYVVHG